MGKFKDYLGESDILNQIYDILDTMSEDEIEEFGEYLFEEFFEGEPWSDEEGEEPDFCITEVKQMILELGEDFYEDVLDMLQPEELDLEEGVTRRMSTSNMNRKKRKFMSLSGTKLRQQKATRKKAARMNKAARKRYYKANKQKIAAYQKSRREAIKSGKHKVKLRRKA